MAKHIVPSCTGAEGKRRDMLAKMALTVGSCSESICAIASIKRSDKLASTSPAAQSHQ